MVKNRYFKNTLGLFAEIIVAAGLDLEETTGTPQTASQVAVPVTIAADPTVGDTITITVDGVEYKHTVPVADETTQQAHDAIKGILSANTQGFTVVGVGTTSSVFTLSWAGADKNGKAVSLVETGSTFTVAGPYAFAGGVDADAAASDDLEAFVANSNAGTVWAFWEDTKVALVTGDTSKPSNLNRKFFYAWKDSAGNTKTTAAIPVAGLKYETKAYNAGQAQISKVKYGGTVSATQIIHVRISETTATVLPYPSYSYSALWTTDIATTVAALVTAINAEEEDKIVTATSAGDTLTLTGDYKNRTFKVSAYLEVSDTQTVDQSTITFPTAGTQVAKAALGDVTTVQEIEKYANIYGGGINYAPEGTNVAEWQESNSNMGSTTQWGILMVYAARVSDGVVYDHKSKAYVIIVVPTGSEATLALL